MPDSRPGAVRLDDLIDAVHHGPSDPLARLEAAGAVADQLNAVADHLLGHFVDAARRSGASWSDIGRRLGVTKQAAQQRFVPGRAPDDRTFHRFTTRARNVVLAAHDAAVAGRSAEVTPAHLVLGLLSEPQALAGVALQAQGIPLEAVRAAATAALPRPADDPPALVPYGTGARKALELTTREALRLGHDYVGTEHLLLALLEQENGAGPLHRAGVDKAASEVGIADSLSALRARMP